VTDFQANIGILSVVPIEYRWRSEQSIVARSKLPSVYLSFHSTDSGLTQFPSHWIRNIILGPIYPTHFLPIPTCGGHQIRLVIWRLSAANGEVTLKVIIREPKPSSRIAGSLRSAGKTVGETDAKTSKRANGTTHEKSLRQARSVP
jgi:hypothetical protein